MRKFQRSGTFEECGYNCAVPIRKLRNEQSELHDAVEDENFVYKKEYYAVKRILAEMQKCVKRTMSGSVFDTVLHGFPLNKSQAPIIDLRVIMTNHKLIIRLQDNCPKFDVGARITKLAEADQQEKIDNLGTWLTKNLADETRYVYSFETNTIFMEFHTDRE